MMRKRAPVALASMLCLGIFAYAKNPDSFRQFFRPLPKDQKVLHALNRLTLGRRPGEVGRSGKGREGLRQVAGLEKEQLYKGRDLALTTDFRDVLGELASHHLGNLKLQGAFPGYDPKFQGLV